MLCKLAKTQCAMYDELCVDKSFLKGKNMKIKDILPFVVIFLLAQYIFYQTYKIETLNNMILVDKKEKQIDADQIRDLMHQLQNNKIENSAISTNSFVAGVIEGTQRKEYYTQVWHDGYDRGSQNQIVVDLTENEKPEVSNVSYEEPAEKK